MLTDVSSASCIVVCCLDQKKDRQGSACVKFFQLCIQKQCLKKYRKQFENSHLLDCRHKRLMQLERCAQVREFML